MSRDAKEVKCPFYKDETSHAIRCEGIISEACNNNFRGPQIKKAHKDKYCNNGYEECEYGKSVMRKYE